MPGTKTWSAKEIRRTFLNFFEERGHLPVPSAPIVIKDDPSLMFTNAGMNQFKDAFLGNDEPPSTRVTDSQKCLRVSGKHNDLEEVGHDTYHHTMFEMLGNWSFGDYFKEDTIRWSWELLTEVYGLAADRLYVTVFEGDAGDALDRDIAAEAVWRELVPADRILNGDKADNFWEMGATGPCGPCSEIHIDLRSEEDRAKQSGAELVNQDHPQVVEIWNLVFMQYQRMANGKLEKLPAQHVDTGMGFERLCMALQDKRSNYDTDVFQPLIQQIAKLAKKQYGQDESVDIAMRVIADHVRAVAFAIADGQLPANNGAGYVIRRILRRAIRYGFSYLDLKKPFMFGLVATLEQQMAEFFPEIKKQRELVEKVIQEEEQSFLRTLEQGLNRLEQMTAEAKGKEIAGARVFELYDTFGFPPDLTALILREQGFHYDQKAYDAEMKKQKERARAATQLDTGDWTVLEEDHREEFIGYDQKESQVRITRYRKVKAKKKDLYQLVFNLTPFYPEGGGQVGDQGVIESDKEKIRIIDTKKEHGLIVHLAEKLPEFPEALWQARIDSSRQKETSLNHSATHLLHHALRTVLGDHVEQKGSLVHPDYLRFDFSHFAKLSEAEWEKIENQVNEAIRANRTLEEFRNLPMTEAQEMGAMALFGEKYGDTVRVIKFGDSIELCGGIHVGATGQIGLFVITHEGAVAAGVRRIEALTGEKARQHLLQQKELLDEVKALLKNPNDLRQGVEQLKQENQGLKKTVEAFKQKEAAAAYQAWQDALEEQDGKKYLFLNSELEAGQVKDQLFKMRKEYPNLVAVVASASGEKPNLAVAFGDEILAQSDWKAGAVVKELAQYIRGGGGGQPGLAMAGGSDKNGLQTAIAEARKKLML